MPSSSARSSKNLGLRSALSRKSLGYKEDEYWIDVHKDLAKKLKSHIGRYTWKKAVELSEIDPSDTQIYAIYVTPKATQNHEMFHSQDKDKDFMCGKYTKLAEYSEAEPGNYVNHPFFDPRRTELGIRMVGCRETFSKDIFHEVSLEVYHRFQIINGITEGQQLADKIPFQYNIDLLKGISFTKGCYLGQELISRSYHTGIVRKRVFPFNLEDQDSMLAVDTILKGSSGKILGKVIHSQGPVGLALLDYLTFTD